MKNLSLIALLLVLLASCQQADEFVSPADSQLIVSRAQSTRSFQGNLQSSINPDPSGFTLCAGPIAGFGVPDHFLDGQATHLGNINETLSTLHHDNCNLDLTTMTLTTSVSGQITGADGDLIYYAGEDVIDVFNYVTGSGSTGSIVGTWSITGGTGRFDGASGSFTISGLVDFTTGTFSAEANGTITY